MAPTRLARWEARLSREMEGDGLERKRAEAVAPRTCDRRASCGDVRPGLGPDDGP